MVVGIVMFAVVTAKVVEFLVRGDIEQAAEEVTETLVETDWH